MTPIVENYDDFVVGFKSDPEKSILDAAATYGMTILLAFADDGVVWGKSTGDALVLCSQEVFDALTITGITKLQQLYLFGPRGQILLWRESASFRASIIQDDGLPVEDENGSPVYFDEEYFLWGSAVEAESTAPCTTLVEENRGFVLKIPLQLTANQQASLKVRHYTTQDPDGQLYIAFSRLVDLVQGR